MSPRAVPEGCPRGLPWLWCLGTCSLAAEGIQHLQVRWQGEGGLAWGVSTVREEVLGLERWSLRKARLG